jgi:hypothetical protein
MGSNKALLVPNEAEANNPIDPVITLASSDKISPNKFSLNDIKLSWIQDDLHSCIVNK